MPRARRTTVAEVASLAGVGVATVDRVLNRRAAVKEETARRVLEAAQALGFHGTALLRKRVEDAGPERTLGFLLQKGSQAFYRNLGAELARAVRACPELRGRPLVHFLDDLSPSHVATRLLQLAARSDALAVVAANHPKVNEAVEHLRQSGLPVFTLLSDLGTAARAGFVGIDHRKAGRTAGWSIARLSRAPGPVGICVGSHRYLGQELCEISFRSYFREYAPSFELLEPIASLEEPTFAQEAALDLLKRNPGLVGLYVAGGGVEGVIAALRDHAGFRNIVTVCNELIPETRSALIDGVVDVVIATPLAPLAARVVAAMAAALKGHAVETPQSFLPFDLYVSENL